MDLVVDKLQHVAALDDNVLGGDEPKVIVADDVVTGVVVAAPDAHLLVAYNLDDILA